MLKRLKDRDRGAAAVEFALVAPLLLLIVFGLIDFGRMLNAKIVISEAAREAARSAALEPAVDPQGRVDLATTGLLGGTAKVQAGTLVTCAARPAVGSNAKATVTYTFQYVTPLGAFAGMFNNSAWGQFQMSSTGVMPCRA